ncbi:MAG: ATP-binding protein, partial [Bacteroidaceae bacterium]|nr:ATP-binding protein [Bacteroidaceae bacterium]
MEDIIHVLPDSVANQIAAGEVVQRPSSIVKEMVENSIDAGAHNIQVLVVDGGKANVQIVDDGKGMSETDARLSFERHATSKIRSAADLFSLSTMGFRGEALASIAAVAHVELKTRREEDELGTSIEIAGSKVVSQEPVSCPVGSNFSVKDLFYNVPARRKFLKSAQTEMTNIVQDFERIVLVNPDISFNLFNNGAEMFRLPAATVRQRIIDVFGKKINADLLPIEAETSLVTITGYVTKPESSKKKGAKRFF